MRGALLFFLLLSFACHSTSSSTPASTPKDEAAVTQKGPKISFEINTPQAEYQASFAPSGGFVSPEVKLGVVLKNEGEGAWVCEPASMTLEVFAQNSKRSEKKSFPLPTPGCELGSHGTLEASIEAGAFLTEIASGYMKGDDLTIKARVSMRYKEGASAVNISSNPITIHLFVPEG